MATIVGKSSNVGPDPVRAAIASALAGQSLASVRDSLSASRYAVSDINPGGIPSLVGAQITGGTSGASKPLQPTGVTPGQYGDSSHVGQFTVNAQGLLTQAAEIAVSGGGGAVLAGPGLVLNTSTKILRPAGTDGLAITSQSVMVYSSPGATATLHASGGAAPYTWAVSGLPATVTLNASTGVLTVGAEAVAGSFPIVVTVNDADDDQTNLATTLLIALATAYTEAVIADAPLGYWRLNEASGSTTAIDYSGNDTSLQYGDSAAGIASPAVGAGTAFGGLPAPVFTGANKEGVVLPSGVITTATASVTLEAMVLLGWPAANSFSGAFIKNGNAVGASENGYGVGVGSGTLDANGNDLIGIAESVAWLNPSGTPTVSITGWHLVQMRINADQSTDFFIDGALVGSVGAVSFVAPTAPFVVGCDPNSSGSRFLTGTLSDVAVYGTALSNARIAAHYTASGL